ncbi:hypothetical protein BB558_005012 [Smittium angustum]|uniref:Ras modification protein ERF4 n=1 Tax=Smittium angustum TaxID=133377 RepID=A0A2U1J1N8_SMIAN|nr:hypothetical protein BB558_005012 [Smittium angustum]
MPKENSGNFKEYAKQNEYKLQRLPSRHDHPKVLGSDKINFSKDTFRAESSNSKLNSINQALDKGELFPTITKPYSIDRKRNSFTGIAKIQGGFDSDTFLKAYEINSPTSQDLNQDLSTTFNYNNNLFSQSNSSNGSFHYHNREKSRSSLQKAIRSGTFETSETLLTKESYINTNKAHSKDSLTELAGNRKSTITSTIANNKALKPINQPFQKSPKITTYDHLFKPLHKTTEKHPVNSYAFLNKASLGHHGGQSSLFNDAFVPREPSQPPRVYIQRTFETNPNSELSAQSPDCNLYNKPSVSRDRTSVIAHNSMSDFSFHNGNFRKSFDVSNSLELSSRSNKKLGGNYKRHSDSSQANLVHTTPMSSLHYLQKKENAESLRSLNAHESKKTITNDIGVYNDLDIPEASIVHGNDNHSYINSNISKYNKSVIEIPRSAEIRAIYSNERTNRIRIQRDYSSIGFCKFYTGIPPELAEKVDPQKYSNFINTINSLMVEAKGTRVRNFVEGLFECLTLYIYLLISKSHYQKTIEKLSNIIQEYNQTVFNPAGFTVLDPRQTAFMFIEFIRT